MYSDIEHRQQRMTARLRRLSVDVQPPYDWLEFRRRAQIRAASREGPRSNGLPYVAAAAALLILIVGSAFLVSQRRGIHIVAHSPPAPARGPAASNADRRARDAERWLASLPPEPVIVRFGTRVAVTRLEDRIAQVDDLLTAANFEGVQPARVAALQRERGRLVDSLAQVRFAEALAANAP